jgi:tRNA nucleotidyltransferase (CCA-adding enzyme)
MPVELVLGRALGAEWLDRYLLEWRNVGLEIDGRDLIAAGVPEGPAVGRGLAEALRRKLDGQIAGREEELKAALEGAGGTNGVA